MSVTWDKAAGSGFFWLVGLAVLLGAWLGERAREHEATARVTAAEQRVQRGSPRSGARLARELHDVIAHGGASMSAQAASRLTLRERPTPVGSDPIRPLDMRSGLAGDWRVTTTRQ